MTDKKLTLEWLVKNFHSDFEEMYESFRASRGDRLTYNDSIAYFIALFPEALKAFARHIWDQACERQREICADFADFDSENLKASCGLGSEYYKIDKEAILNAPAPEFKLIEK